MAQIARALLLGTIVLLPIQLLPAVPALHPRSQWSDLAFAAAFLVWLLGVRRAPQGRAVPLALGWYLGSAALAWASSGAPDPAGAIKLVGVASLVAFATLIASETREPKAAALAGRAVAAAAVLASVAAIAGTLLYFGGTPTALLGSYGDLVPGDYPRSRGSFLHPNGLASFTIAAAGLVASPRAALPRPLVVALQVLLALAAVASLSRGVLGLAVALAIAAARTPARRALALAVSVAALIAVAAASLGHPRLDPTRPWEVEWLDESSPRRQALSSAGTTVVEHPLGIGPGGLAARVAGRPFEAHCTPLNVAATLGLPAAVALLGLPVLLWRRRGRPTDLAAWGALAGLAIDGLAQDVEDFRHVWLVLGWLWADVDRGVPDRR